MFDDDSEVPSSQEQQEQHSIVRRFTAPPDPAMAAAYEGTLATDTRFASIHQRAERRLPISADDFLYLRQPILDAMEEASGGAHPNLTGFNRLRAAFSLPQAYLIAFTLHRLLDQMT